MWIQSPSSLPLLPALGANLWPGGVLSGGWQVGQPGLWALLSRGPRVIAPELRSLQDVSFNCTPDTELSAWVLLFAP